ncbi:hypothetical protein B484DRAFT_456707 [Ochromonadaceae sp. CCMP2298]|nr:hypothetical protein B484DRAFT_456707 [Ochromonadaceae sp. CCMP2298]
MNDFEDDEEEDEENVAVAKLQYWHINVHVHGKTINISCGDATQRLKWLAHVAIARWDAENCQGWKRLGMPTTVRAKRKDGDEVDMGMTIRDVLQNGDHVFIETSLAPSETQS